MGWVEKVGKVGGWGREAVKIEVQQPRELWMTRSFSAAASPPPRRAIVYTCFCVQKRPGIGRESHFFFFLPSVPLVGGEEKRIGRSGRAGRGRASRRVAIVGFYWYAYRGILYSRGARREMGFRSRDHARDPRRMETRFARERHAPLLHEISTDRASTHRISASRKIFTCSRT